jgi:hypothetical protein
MAVVGIIYYLLIGAAIVIVCLGSLIFYFRYARLSAAVMFVCSIVALMASVGWMIYPQVLKAKAARTGSLTADDLIPMQVLSILIAVCAIAFSVAFWQLLRSVVPAQGEHVS